MSCSLAYMTSGADLDRYISDIDLYFFDDPDYLGISSFFYPDPVSGDWELLRFP